MIEIVGKLFLEIYGKSYIMEDFHKISIANVSALVQIILFVDTWIQVSLAVL